MRFTPLFLFIFLFACNEKEPVDLLVVNAEIYTVDSNFSLAQAMAIKNGKIIAVGKSEEIQQKYSSKSTLNAKGKTILPGLIDAHCHFFGLGLQQQKVDVSETKSFAEVVKRIVEFQKEKQVSYITGRGWDQNDWEVKEFPDKRILDRLFPETPVAMTRIDGHALLANQKALELAGITTETSVSGGKIEKKDGKLTGVLIDNAMEMVYKSIPKPSKEESVTALMQAQEICLGYGLTTVDDAGLEKETIQLIDSLQKSGDLKIRIYAMAIATPENVDFYLKNGPVKTDRLHVRSFKIYADGALGSRGAVLKEPYSDMPHHFGTMLIGINEFKKLAGRIQDSKFQANTHAIGDSANAVVLRTYDSLLTENKDRRWRVEHAQIIDAEDFHYFSKNIIPSVQPTHATSDMYWAEDRLGPKRIKNAYAFNKLLEQAGIVALGTDFPVEKVSPFLTFYAAVSRKDLKGFPPNGFQPENALSREETLKGMTIWAAYANFEENEKGSLEPGKFADFVILNQNIMEVEISKIPKTQVLATYISGEKVH
ncbi:MAG TPA: amidohydrolase [Flavobacteriaceae bacterium]|nr:amidohydrolase [Flavobacteriaceae bacterium]